MYKLSDGFGSSGFICCLIRRGEFGGELKVHLTTVVKRRPDLERGTGFASNTLEKVVKFTPNGEGCAGENNTGGGFKEGFSEDGTNVDRSG